MSDFKDFINLVHSIRDKELLGDFLIGVTTGKEREKLAHRVDVVKRLLTGEPQQMIAEDLGVGVATVTRGSRELALGRFKVLRTKK
jgi:TrpR family transcriptional regulator, trp operon repressor